MFMVVVYCDGYIKCTTFDQGFYKVTVIVWYRTQWAFVLNFVGIYIYIYIYIVSDDRESWIWILNNNKKVPMHTNLDFNLKLVTV